MVRFVVWVLGCSANGESATSSFSASGLLISPFPDSPWSDESSLACCHLASKSAGLITVTCRAGSKARPVSRNRLPSVTSVTGVSPALR